MQNNRASIYYISTVNAQHMQGPDVLIPSIVNPVRPTHNVWNYFIIFTILLNILIITKNFVMFQVLM